MKIGGRYKLIGKKRHAVLDIPYEQVLDAFEDSLSEFDESSRLSGSIDRETGIFKIEYKLDSSKKEVYETYCLLVQVKETMDGMTKIEYAFVFDRLIAWYTRILSLICFAVPLASAALVYFKFQLHELIHLLIYVPLLLISAFGIFSLAAYREKREEIKPIIKEFEQLLMDNFNE